MAGRGSRSAGAARWTTRAVVVLAGLAVLAVLAGGWHFADQLTLPPDPGPYATDNEVLGVDGDVVTLRDEGFVAAGERWGLELGDDRHVVLDEEVASGDGTTSWRFTDPDGATPQVGEAVRVDEYVWTGDPTTAHGLAFEQVDVAGPLGALPSWWVPTTGASVGTVVFVHGRGGTQEESLRFLPAMVGAGWDVLVQTYRGDPGAPDWPDGRVRFGTTEWEDVEAAVDHVTTRAPDRPVVVFGTSMGGALIGQFLDRSGRATEVAGVVLDSPVLSMDALLDLQAGLNGVPEWAEPLLLPAVKLWAGVIHGVDTGALEQAEADDTFDLPLLLVHGRADDFVPFEPSLAYAEDRLGTGPRDGAAAGDAFLESGDGLMFLDIPDAGHVRGWNADPATYDDVLTAFLDEVAA